MGHFHPTHGLENIPPTKYKNTCPCLRKKRTEQLFIFIVQRHYGKLMLLGFFVCFVLNT